MSDPTGPVSMTLDDIEAQEAAQAEAAKNAQAPDLTAIKLEGDNIPAELRGKSISEVVQQYGSLATALRISESARTATPAAPPAAPVVEEPKDLTMEELTALHAEDPLRAMQVMQEQADRRAQKNLETRLAPIAAASAANVEAAARVKYADEFTLFGDQISQLAAQIPNAKQVLSNPAAWDDLISLIRGRAGNFEKIVEHRASGRPTITREQAQQQQQESVGFSDPGSGRGRPALSVANLDPIQKEIAAKMNMTEAEYVQWSRV